MNTLFVLEPKNRWYRSEYSNRRDRMNRQEVIEQQFYEEYGSDGAVLTYRVVEFVIGAVSVFKK